MNDDTRTSWQGYSSQVEQTIAIGRAIGGHAHGRDVIALIGELGAGKTQLTKGIAAAMGIDERAVSSPTFVLMHEHEPEDDGPALVHVDAYRVKSGAEIEAAGFDGEGQADAVTVVEWADRITDALGANRLVVRLDHDGDGRLIDITAHGDWLTRMQDMHIALDRALRPAEPAPCPICKKPVREDDETFPFCSKRCRTIDLGKWLGGDYRITRRLELRDLEEG
jgi:tRNA threonylcarbamoyladenosine biosynthesis protein TsaE